MAGQCQLISLPRSSWYYAWSRKQGGESEENLALLRSIDELYLKHPFFGSRKMAFELDANRKRAGRLMRLMGIEVIYPKRRTTQRNKNHKIYPYLLRPCLLPNVEITRCDQVWSTDITFIPMQHGFVYLVAQDF